MCTYINGTILSDLICISLSSCQLHKPILTMIKIRSLLSTLQAASHNVLHIFIQTVQGYRSRELKIYSLWSSNQGNVSEKSERM